MRPALLGDKPSPEAFLSPGDGHLPGGRPRATLQNAWALGLLSSMMVASGCNSNVPVARWQTTNWPASVVDGLAAIESEVGRPSCTGAVVATAGQQAYVLTAAHCVVDPSGRPVRARSVALPKREGNAVVWQHAPVARALLSAQRTVPPEPPDAGKPESADMVDDWSILELRPLTAPGVMALPSRAEPARLHLQLGTRVSLHSFFDWHYDNLYPHEHAFAWGSFSNDILKAGHSGAPVVSHGTVVAVFSGGQPPSEHGPAPKLTFTGIETVLTEAAACGFVVDAMGRAQVSDAAACWMPVPTD